MDDLQQPPLPADLPTAHKELRYWQRQVIRERERVVRIVEKRAMDQRSARGEIKKLRDAALRFLHDIELTNTHKNHQAICDLNKALGR